MQSPEPLTREDRTWGMMAHLLAAAGHLVAVLSWLGPLIVWLVKKDTSRFAAFHGLQSLFFQLAWMVILAIGWAIVGFSIIGCVAVPAMIALQFVPAIWAVVAGIKANNGEWYQYPVVGEIALRMVVP
jgi:uncharacterized protein